MIYFIRKYIRIKREREIHIHVMFIFISNFDIGLTNAWVNISHAFALTYDRRVHSAYQLIMLCTQLSLWHDVKVRVIRSVIVKFPTEQNPQKILTGSLTRQPSNPSKKRSHTRMRMKCVIYLTEHVLIYRA